MHIYMIENKLYASRYVSVVCCVCGVMFIVTIQEYRRKKQKNEKLKH